MQDECRPDEVLEKLAGSVMAAELDDKSSLAKIAIGLKELEIALDDGTDEATREQVRRMRERMEEILLEACDEPQIELDRICNEVAELQEKLAQNQGTEREDAAKTGRFVLPEWVDESIFLEFISSSKIVLEELESDMLALEGGELNVLADLRGKIHSIKGEAGILGLNGLEAVCHTLEDYLQSESWTADQLLKAKDWMVEALQAYARSEIPGDEDILVELRGCARAEGEALKEDCSNEEPVRQGCDGESGGDSHASIEAPPVDNKETVWDEESLEIVAEFLQECDEGLTQVDEILLSAEQEGVEEEQVNAVFRVFHTIKGVAGFLELTEITKLAHTTETMLDHVRKGDLLMRDAVLDLVFDSTEIMRRMVVDLRHAVSQGIPTMSDPDLPKLLGRLRSAIQGHAEEEQLPQAASDDRLGDILASSPSLIPRPVIEDGLQAQKETGRRLGEELVARGEARPKQVAQALRAQKRAGENDARGTKLKDIVKVDLARVDNLVSLIGELVIVEAMIVNAPELSEKASPWLRKNISQMSKITSDLQDIGTRMRMVPVRGVFQKMARMVRDLSRKNGKDIGAEMAGEGTEMDRSMVEQIADPLVHMIRNAADHGIEPAEERVAAGKPQRGTVKLFAYHEGGSVVIEVSDDGRGLNRDAILAKAREKGVIKNDSEPTEQEIYNLVFAPGFSTAKKVTEISGRGVGMDVVRRNIESIRGSVKIDSVPGKGSTFTMVLPLTLAIIDGMLITCGEERYIIPTLSVVESLKPESSMVFSVAGRGEIVSMRGETFPLFRLDRLLGIPDAIQDFTTAMIVVVVSHGKKIGLLVDEVLTQQQVVIKGLGDGLPGTGYLSGAAIMSNGHVGLILNTGEITNLIDSNIFHAESDESPQYNYVPQKGEPQPVTEVCK